MTQAKRIKAKTKIHSANQEDHSQVKRAEGRALQLVIRVIR
jgi:hypothetical protein